MPFPADLFGSGEYGYALDPTDPGAVWQQIDGTVAGATGQPVGRLDDVSGNGRHFAAAANNTTRPTLQADGSVLFDGSNDALLLDEAGLWDAGAATIIVVVSGESQKDRRWWAEGYSASNTPFYVPYAGTPAGAGVDARTFSRANNNATVVDGDGSVTLFDNDPHVVRIVDTGSEVTIYVDGVAGTTRSYSRSSPLTVNRTGLGCLYRSAAGTFFAGRIKRGIWIGRLLDGTETADAEAWAASAWSGGSGVTGTLAATETGSDTVSITGAVAVSGTMAAAESGADAAAISGTVRVSGQLGAAETGADTASLSGSVPVAGTLSAAESGSDAAALAGTVLVTGAMAAQESGADTADISGRVTVAGTLDATETGSDTAHFSGSKQETVTGTLAASEAGPDTALMTGAVVVAGALAASESGNDTASLSGTIPIGGQLAAVEPANDNASMAGRVQVSGTLAAIEVGSDTARFFAGEAPPPSIQRTASSLNPARLAMTAGTPRRAVSAR